MVHPCGSGAFGYFEVERDVTSLCKADFLSSIGKRTPIFTRFSTTTYGREFPDSARNVRGFAIKFYTEEGNYDILGLNLFFVRNPMKGPDLIRSQQRNPQSGLLDYEALFSYLAENPEALHAGTMHFSDRGTPKGWRFMDGFGCHTFKWVNSKGDQIYIKYHFLCEAGKQEFTDEEAQQMCGQDPDYSKRDLFNHIQQGGECTWKIAVQMMTPDQANRADFDPFDVTKVWPHADFPLQQFGKLVLNRNPENFHRDVEQAAFNPGNLVPGIEPSPDALLQWRMMFYRDAQYHRLGVNHHQLPVNCPFMARYQNPQTRDGQQRLDSNGVGHPSVICSSKNEGKVDSSVDFHPFMIREATVDRESAYRHEGSDSDYDQVRELVERVLNQQKRENLYKNTAKYLRLCSLDTQSKYLSQLSKISTGYADGVKRWLEKAK
ncbi:hypothetical protein P9112_000531 [Eukaryota sp. TZLM1-RC]